MLTKVVDRKDTNHQEYHSEHRYRNQRNQGQRRLSNKGHLTQSEYIETDETAPPKQGSRAHRQHNCSHKDHSDYKLRGFKGEAEDVDNVAGKENKKLDMDDFDERVGESISKAEGSERCRHRLVIIMDGVVD